jgi:hypothetical protein
MPSFLLNTHSTNPDAEVGCRVAYVEMTPKLAKLVLKRIRAFKAAKKADGTLYEMHFWDGSLDYLTDVGASKVPEQAQRALEQEGVTTVAAKFRNVDLTEEDFDRTECDVMLVREGGVSWTAIPKHTDIYVSTEEIQLDELKRCTK